MWEKLIRSGKLRVWTKTIMILFFLALLLWIARYWHFKDFGLYEDDLTVIPNVMGMTSSQYFDLLIDHLGMLHPHGRPLSNSFIYTFTFLGNGKSFNDLYLFGFGIETLNLVLFYYLLKRLFDEKFAVIGGISFVLFSADTTQAYLTHAYALHPTLLFLLLAFHSYLSGKRWLLYIFGVLILFTYEASYFILLAAPLLSLRWDKKLLKELGINTVLLFLIIAGVYVFRSSVGDFRSIDLTVNNLLITPVLHMIEGPIVAMGTYLYRPLQAIRAINSEVGIAILGSFIVFVLVLTRIFSGESDNSNEFIDSIRRNKFSALRESIKNRRYPSQFPTHLKRLVKLTIIGIIFIVLAYPLTFTVRAYAISGRDTRVHFAAVVGAAILCTCLSKLLFSISEYYKHRRIMIVSMSLLFAFLMGYGFVIQRDYINAWDYQQEFWREIVRITSDADEGTVILVEPTGLKYTRQIDANTWNLPRVLDQIYKYPSDWEDPPRVYRLVPGWQDHILGESGQFIVNASTTIAPAVLYREIPSTDVIFIETYSGRLSRRTEPLVLFGKSYELYKTPAHVVMYDENVLYDFLVGSDLLNGD